jgi:hypothetical protein
VAGGRSNQAGDNAGTTSDAQYATIGGGESNTASAYYATIGGGYYNDATGYRSAIGGGSFNDATGDDATVAGGVSNIASGLYASVGGGYQNTADTCAAVGGGWSNDAYMYATVGGGFDNVAGPYATIGGGVSDTASGYYSTIGGGRRNTAQLSSSTVGGGFWNTAGSNYATVGGGRENEANLDYSTVSGGLGNTADHLYATVGGGVYNTADGQGSTVGGGGDSDGPAFSNAALGDWSTVSGGRSNVASGQMSTVAGGYTNRAEATSASVGGGASNYASDIFSTVPGGWQNNAAARFSFAAGRRAKANHTGAFVWADSTDADFASISINEFAARAGGGMRVIADNGFYGAYFSNSAGGGDGIRAIANVSSGVNWGAVYAINSGTSPAVYASATTAGYFSGNVTVTGTLSKGGGSFKIDHPLDPENKYLYHSFVESPDMMNIYNGNAVLDSRGEAWVELPEWFGALNRDFRYQLTCIGGFAPVYVAEKISNNRFKIAGGEPHMEISWQVTGIRQDAFANAHRIPVEEEKTGEERGMYLHPTEHGVSETMGMGYEAKMGKELR